MNSKPLLLLALLALARALFGQFDPQDAQVVSYFPQLADGGPRSQQWITSLTLINPNGSFGVGGQVFLYANDGSALSLDFGSGPVSNFTFSLPPQGTVTFTTTGAPGTTVTGWAKVLSSLPVQGVIQFRNSANGVPQQGVSAQTTQASALFRSAAGPTTGIAIANIYSAPLAIYLVVLDSNGGTVANSSVTLNPLGHTSFTLGQMFPSLPSNFRGTVLIGPAAPNIVNANCVAWTLSADLGVLASYPPSGLFWPVSQTERIWRVWNKVLAAGTASFALKLPPSLMIDQTVGRLNIIANPTLNQVYILMNLAELIGDSDSELSFALGHALGHIIQFRVGALNFFPDDRERDADVYGMVVSWEAGYDPYGAAGVLGKLFMVSGGENMLAQDFDFLQSAGLDLRTSFGNRLANIYDTLKAGCAIAENQSACAAYKSVVHPHFPLYAPL